MKILCFSGLVFLVSLVFSGCIYNESEKVKMAQEGDKRYTTTIAWEDTLRSLNDIEEGQSVEVVFRFTNTGDKPLIISDVQVSCGCTVPEKPSEPILPGKKGYIKAVFNSESRLGPNYKTITVTSNSYPERSKELAFKVQVNPVKTEQTKE